MSGLEYETALEYWQAITVIESQQSLVNMEIADWPNLKDNQRKKLHKERYKLASVETGKEKVLTNDQIFDFLQNSM